MEKRINCINISKSYDYKMVLQPCNVSFEQGSLSLFQGPNGSGKSTFLSIVALSLRPNQGVVEYRIKIEKNEEIREKIGYLAHELHLYGDLSGKENLEFVSKMRGMNENNIQEIQDEIFDLKNFFLRPVKTYSRGQKQKIALLRTFLHDPEVYIFDEPTTGLDKEGMVDLKRKLEKEKNRGKIILLSTHEPENFDSLADRHIRIVQGRMSYV